MTKALCRWDDQHRSVTKPWNDKPRLEPTARVHLMHGLSWNEGFRYAWAGMGISPTASHSGDDQMPLPLKEETIHAEHPDADYLGSTWCVKPKLADQLRESPETIQAEMLLCNLVAGWNNTPLMYSRWKSYMVKVTLWRPMERTLQVSLHAFQMWRGAKDSVKKRWVRSNSMPGADDPNWSHWTTGFDDWTGSSLPLPGDWQNNSDKNGT